MESSTAVKADYNCQETTCEPIIFPIYGENGRMEIEKGTTATIICASIGAKASLVSPSGEVIGRKGALKLRNPQENHEGTYKCVSGDVQYQFDVTLVESQQPSVDPVPEIARDFFAAESDEVIILDDYDSDDLISTNDSETIDLGPAFTMNFDLGSELEGKGPLFEHNFL